MVTTEASKRENQAAKELNDARVAAFGSVPDAQTIPLFAKQERREKWIINGVSKAARDIEGVPYEYISTLILFYQQAYEIYYQAGAFSQMTPTQLTAKYTILNTIGRDIGKYTAAKDFPKNWGLRDAFKEIVGLTLEVKTMILDSQKLSSRIKSTVGKVLGGPVMAGVLAGAASRNPLIGLAVAAYQKNKEGKSGDTFFHGVAEVTSKEAERAQAMESGGAPVSRSRASVAGDQSSTPSIHNTEPLTQDEVFARDDAELTRHAASGAPTPTTTPKNTASPINNVASYGPGRGSDTTLATILNKHTGLLTGTLSNTRKLVELAEKNTLAQEETAEESGNITASASQVASDDKTPKKGIFGMLSTMMGSFSKLSSIGTIISGAIAGAGPVFAALAAPVLASVLAVKLGLKIRDLANDITNANEGLGKAEGARGRADRITQVNKARAKRGLAPFQGSEKELYTAAALGESSTPAPSKPAPSSPAPAAPAASASQAPAAATPAPTATQSTAAPTTPTATATAIPSVPTGGLPLDYDSYAATIGKRESSNRYDAVNTIGYLGKYQLGSMALEDVGMLKKGASKKGSISKVTNDPNNWTIPGGKEAFLKNGPLQEAIMKKYTLMNYKTLVRIKALDKTSAPEKVAGLLAASHLLGPGDATKQLSKTDAYGSSGSSYFALGQASQSAASTRVASSTGGGTSPAGDSARAPRASMTAALSAPPVAASPGVTPVVVVNNKNTQVAAGGGGQAPMQAPVDNSPVIRRIVSA